MSGTDPGPAETPASTRTARRKNPPPIGQRWRRGQSGNPTGQSKALAEVKVLAREYGREALERLVELMRGRSAKVALAAAREILDRAYGKPTVEIAGPGGGPIPLGIVPGVPIPPEMAAAAYAAVMRGDLDPDALTFAPPAAPAPALEHQPIERLPVEPMGQPAASATVETFVERIEREASESRAGSRRTWEELAK